MTIARKVCVDVCVCVKCEVNGKFVHKLRQKSSSLDRKKGNEKFQKQREILRGQVIFFHRFPPKKATSLWIPKMSYLNMSL